MSDPKPKFEIGDRVEDHGSPGLVDDVHTTPRGNHIYKIVHDDPNIDAFRGRAYVREGALEEEPPVRDN
jgi:hypothetical protein